LSKEASPLRSADERIDEAIVNDPASAAPPSSDKSRRGEHGLAFAFCAFLSAFMIGHLIYNRSTFSDAADWIMLGGGIWFSLWAILSFFAMLNNWGDEQFARFDRITETVARVVLAPVALIVAALVAVLVGVALFSAFGWLATIPSWAAVIIVLLVLIYFKLK
jgi:hypothetical protein